MGPLKGFVVIELAGIGPAPFAGMLYFHLLIDGLAERGELDV